MRRPFLILRRLDGVETGIRQLIRRRPLEVEEIEVNGRRLRIPTIEEMARIKGWLVLRRNAVRDHLDLVALASRLGDRAGAVLASVDDYYADQLGPDGRRVAPSWPGNWPSPTPTTSTTSTCRATASSSPSGDPDSSSLRPAGRSALPCSPTWRRTRHDRPPPAPRHRPGYRSRGPSARRPR